MVKPVNIIAACAENLVIGKEGKLPWRIEEDWRYFCEQTRGGALIMGRVTFENIPTARVLLKGRAIVVITKKTALAKKGVTVVATLPEAIEAAQKLPGPIWICGGEKIYAEALPLAHRLYVTLVHARVKGDTFFPEWRRLFTKVISEKLSGDKNFRYTFYILEKA